MCLKLDNYSEGLSILIKGNKIGPESQLEIANIQFMEVETR